MSEVTSPISSIDWQVVRARLAESEGKLAEVMSPDEARVRTILEERAARLRQEVGGAARNREEERKLLLVRVGGERLALELGALRGVEVLKKVSPVPGASREVLGVMNLNGELHAVLNPLGGKGEVGELSKWGVVLRHERLRVVLAVEELLRMVTVEMKGAEEVMMVEGEMTVLLDVAELFNKLEESMVDRA
ncbi:chemotaxis protein CheW [Phragmitibacter flavus]|uniref:Chemotaxis protein CheW n=1 Tax=Phragmitibacter flavus TaxID=2576071 RepID=A0A5R8K952_9BACT|nr:chemotaxis protein CheW [Phragmitibacter flavus]TLD68821.1 chemotaxis protein CheW [Phragmitibacter flavus]